MGRFWTLALAAAIGCCGSLSIAAEASTPIGKKIDNFSLPDYRGKVHALDDYKDQLVVVAFIGTECPLAKTYAPACETWPQSSRSKGSCSWPSTPISKTRSAKSAALLASTISSFRCSRTTTMKSPIASAPSARRKCSCSTRRVVRYWGRIDDQYGFKTGAGYVKPKLTRRNLADAIGEVLAGKEVSRAVVKADGCFIGRVAKQQPHGDVTYSNQIARIMQDRCVECHRKGEVAPFTLTSYEDVIGWAETIKEVVQEGRMPPWFADPKFGHFINDARLSDKEKQQLFAWVDNGCPQGNVKDMPEPRKFVEGWQLGEPDQVLYMRDEPYKVQAEGTVEYQFYTVDPGWKTDKWIQATECRPGNRSVVHHIIVFVSAPGGKDGGGRGGIGGYAPGMTPTISPPGTATLVPAGSKLVFQLHYTPNGTEQEDRSMVGVYFADPKTVKKSVRGGLVGDTSFKIPAGDSNFEIKAKHLFLKDTLLLNLTPHMHLRGKDFKYEAEYPDGTREVLLDVPSYDFNWQLRYMLTEPKLMPKGTRLHCTAHFDNSTENAANPDPTKVVTFGDQTWEEMMFGFYTSIDPKEDLSITGLAGGAAKDGEVNGVTGEGSVTAGDAAKKN